MAAAPPPTQSTAVEEPGQELAHPSWFPLHSAAQGTHTPCEGTAQLQPQSRDSLCMGAGGKHQRGQNCNQRIWDLREPWEPLAWPQIHWCSLHETVIEQISSVPRPHLMNRELYSISLQHITPLLLRGMRWNYRYSLTPILLLVWDKMIHVLIKGFEMMVCVSEVPVQSELFLKDYIKA